jgi:hypothetical protein
MIPSTMHLPGDHADRGIAKWLAGHRGVLRMAAIPPGIPTFDAPEVIEAFTAHCESLIACSRLTISPTGSSEHPPAARPQKWEGSCGSAEGLRH